MSEIPFHRTVRGQQFIESTVPKLIEEIAQLNARLAELVQAIDRTSKPAVSNQARSEHRDRVE